MRTNTLEVSSVVVSLNRNTHKKQINKRIFNIFDEYIMDGKVLTLD